VIQHCRTLRSTQYRRHTSQRSAAAAAAADGGGGGGGGGGENQITTTLTLHEARCCLRFDDGLYVQRMNAI